MNMRGREHFFQTSSLGRSIVVENIRQQILAGLFKLQEKEDIVLLVEV